mmetsp:Transcript_6473/g.14155  ORF Transcript_6473/g.14155 Transcript_6473/m.14155 type:complete len:554 (+) Transcript_6473:140-1801(+)|eukprot:CAMPEP_0178437124 /NCGR_PEP_ID=MMETSP0689_2-20121128/34807_1 /TAXON_ID=160604 /ORGANISM="Amphidinium massartii, Strain CS-259" /LENGTH=553 /DNA_ID=CAMNT_0020059269 /DNA_START=61 /DNA_END=1722 /DNA_ORIENTATION=-
MPCVVESSDHWSRRLAMTTRCDESMPKRNSSRMCLPPLGSEDHIERSDRDLPAPTTPVARPAMPPTDPTVAKAYRRPLNVVARGNTEGNFDTGCEPQMQASVSAGVKTPRGGLPSMRSARRTQSQHHYPRTESEEHSVLPSCLKPMAPRAPSCKRASLRRGGTRPLMDGDASQCVSSCPVDIMRTPRQPQHSQQAQQSQHPSCEAARSIYLGQMQKGSAVSSLLSVMRGKVIARGQDPFEESMELQQRRLAVRVEAAAAGSSRYGRARSKEAMSCSITREEFWDLLDLFDKLDSDSMGAVSRRNYHWALKVMGQDIGFLRMRRLAKLDDYFVETGQSLTIAQFIGRCFQRMSQEDIAMLRRWAAQRTARRVLSAAGGAISAVDAHKAFDLLDHDADGKVPIYELQRAKILTTAQLQQFAEGMPILESQPRKVCDFERLPLMLDFGDFSALLVQWSLVADASGNFCHSTQDAKHPDAVWRRQMTWRRIMKRAVTLEKRRLQQAADKVKALFDSGVGVATICRAPTEEISVASTGSPSSSASMTSMGSSDSVESD